MSRLTNVARIKKRGDVKTKEYGHQPYRSSLDHATQMRVATEKAKAYVNPHLPESEMVRPYASNSYEEAEYNLVPEAGRTVLPSTEFADLNLSFDVDWDKPMSANAAFEDSWGEPSGETVTQWTTYIDTFRTSTNGDDGRWYGGTFKAGGMQVGDEYGSNKYNSFCRFPNTTIQDTGQIEILSAVFTVWSYAFNNSTVCRVKMYFEDSLDAIAPTNATEANALSLTTGFEYTVPAWSQNAWKSFTDITSELQQIMDKPDREEGKAVMIVIKDNLSDNNAYREFYGHEVVGTNQHPQLTVMWKHGVEVEV